MINLSKKKFWFRTPRGRQGPKHKIRKRPKKLSAPNFRNFFFKNLYCPKGPFSTYKKFGSPFFDFGELSQKRFFYRTPKANSRVWSLLDWNSQSKWDQICPPRGSAWWAVCNESFLSLQIPNQIIIDRVVEVNLLQRCGNLINSNDSIAVSIFSSLMETLTFGTWGSIAKLNHIWLIFWVRQYCVTQLSPLL